MPSAVAKPGTIEQFTTTLLSRGPDGAWTYIAIPFDVEKTFGSRARVAVAGTMNGAAFQNSLMPRGDGTHTLSVSKAMMRAAGCRPGDTVQMTLQRDTSERTVVVPNDLHAALADDPAAAHAFDALAYSHRKEYVDWIASAKTPPTRARRIAATVTKVREKQKLR